jgi:hypothetical protein
MASLDLKRLLLVTLVSMGMMMACVEGVVNSQELAGLKALRSVFPALQTEYQWTDEILAQTCTTAIDASFGLECRLAGGEYHVGKVYVDEDRLCAKKLRRIVVP